MAGDNYAPITTGDHSPVRVTTVGPLPPVSDVSPAPGPVGIPGHVPLFVGRTGELAGLERDLADGPGVVVQAVHGLGGIGKSALAARYALLHAGEYTQVVWVSAEDPAGIEAGLGASRSHLNLSSTKSCPRTRWPNGRRRGWPPTIGGC